MITTEDKINRLKRRIESLEALALVNRELIEKHQKFNDFFVRDLNEMEGTVARHEIVIDGLQQRINNLRRHIRRIDKYLKDRVKALSEAK